MSVSRRASVAGPLIGRGKSIYLKRLKVALKKVPGLVHLAALYRVMTNPGYRSELMLMRDKPDNLFQPYGYTEYDRFSVLFDFVRKQLEAVESPHLLSFGCSTGEEVFALRRYFPQAEITGIDINPRSIAVCRKKMGKEPAIRFELAGTVDAEPDAYYDAVFCMSVLRHGELGATHPENCEHLIRFFDFEKTVEGFCRCLKPNGYLVVRGSNFRFCDTSEASGFDVVFRLDEKVPRMDTPLYGPDNCRLTDGVYNDVIFRKRVIQEAASLRHGALV